MKFSRAIFLGLIAVLACGAADAAQLVVVEARGIALKPGAVVDSSKALVLKQGQHVTLISDSGATLSLDGPYDKAPAVGQRARPSRSPRRSKDWRRSSRRVWAKWERHVA